MNELSKTRMQLFVKGIETFKATPEVLFVTTEINGQEKYAVLFAIPVTRQLIADMRLALDELEQQESEKKGGQKI